MAIATNEVWTKNGARRRRTEWHRVAVWGAAGAAYRAASQGTPMYVEGRLRRLALEAHVPKGEHGAMVVFADRFTKNETYADGNDVEREIPFLKAYTVFNVTQIEGLPAHYYAQPEAKAEKLQLIEGTEKFFAAAGHPSRRQHGVLRARSGRGPAAKTYQPAP